MSTAGNGGYSEPLTPEQQHQVNALAAHIQAQVRPCDMKPVLMPVLLQNWKIQQCHSVCKVTAPAPVCVVQQVA